MKINQFIILSLCMAIWGCNEDMTEVTETVEIVNFIPNEEEPDTSILDDFPDGIISVDYDGQQKVVEKATAVSTAQETLITTEFIDDVTGEPTKMLIGVKGFSEGEFKGNILGFRIFPLDYDIADITITEYGDVGEAIIGQFSVSFVRNNQEVSISGEFAGLRLN